MIITDEDGKPGIEGIIDPDLITRREVALLVKEGIVRDVDLAVGLQKAAVIVYHRGGVKVVALCFFIDRDYYHYLVLPGEDGEGICGFTRNFLRQMGCILLIPLREVAGPVELRQADDLCSFLRSLFYHPDGFFQVQISVL